VNAPRFHNQWMPDLVNVEQWFSPDTVNGLQHMGYNVEIGLHEGDHIEMYWSDAECIAIDEKTGELKDEVTRGLLKQQLASFATFIARVAAKS